MCLRDPPALHVCLRSAHGTRDRRLERSGLSRTDAAGFVAYDARWLAELRSRRPPAPPVARVVTSRPDAGYVDESPVRERGRSTSRFLTGGRSNRGQLFS